LLLTEVQGFSNIYKSTKTGCGFIGDFLQLLFFTEKEALGEKRCFETGQIKTMSDWEETPVGVVTERLGPGVNLQTEQHFFGLKLGLFGFVLGLFFSSFFIVNCS
jgi:hypothetical protein